MNHTRTYHSNTINAMVDVIVNRDNIGLDLVVVRVRMFKNIPKAM